MLTEEGSRSRSHGLRIASLQAQASALQLPLLTANASWDQYESEFIRLLATASQELHATHAIFGDVFPESNKQWAERVCHECELTALEPLWAQPTDLLVREFLREGGDARIVTVRDTALDSSWLGKQLTEPLVDELIAAGVDPCGENGEYHTFVSYFPGFRRKLELKRIATAQHGGCTMLDFAVDE